MDSTETNSKRAKHHKIILKLNNENGYILTNEYLLLWLEFNKLKILIYKAEKSHIYDNALFDDVCL